MIKKYDKSGKVIVEVPIRPSLYFAIELYDDEWVFEFPFKYHRLAVEKINRWIIADMMNGFEGSKYFICEVCGDEEEQV